MAHKTRKSAITCKTSGTNPPFSSQDADLSEGYSFPAIRTMLQESPINLSR